MFVKGCYIIHHTLADAAKTRIHQINESSGTRYYVEMRRSFIIATKCLGGIRAFQTFGFGLAHPLRVPTIANKGICQTRITHPTQTQQQQNLFQWRIDSKKFHGGRSGISYDILRNLFHVANFWSTLDCPTPTAVGSGWCLVMLRDTEEYYNNIKILLHNTNCKPESNGKSGFSSYTTLEDAADDSQATNMNGYCPTFVRTATELL